MLQFERYEPNAGYRITTASGHEYTCAGAFVNIPTASIVEEDSNVVAIEKFCDDYRAYTIAKIKGAM